MEQIILNVIEQFGYVGICLLIAVENIFPPIPSEVILTFGGFMTTFSTMNIWWVILVATIGSLIGALVLYTIGRLLNTERLEKLVQGKFGKIMHLKSGDIQKAEKWFGKHGNKAVFFCRFVPIVRSLISIPAGITKMKLGSFLFLTISGTFIWNVILVYLGRFAGNAWETIAAYVDIYSMISAVVFMLIALIIGAFFIKKRFIANNSEEIN